MNNDCLFCNIINGDMEAYRVNENENTVSFLDAFPVTRGHTLVVPKTHVRTIDELDPKQIPPLFEEVQLVASAIDQTVNPDGINIMQNNGKAAGQEIDHVHVHIIPRFENDNVQISFEQDELDEHNPDRLVENLQKNLSSQA